MCWFKREKIRNLIAMINQTKWDDDKNQMAKCSRFCIYRWKFDKNVAKIAVKLNFNELKVKKGECVSERACECACDWEIEMKNRRENIIRKEKKLLNRRMCVCVCVPNKCTSITMANVCICIQLALVQRH